MNYVIMSDEEGPPIRQYPETPMPTHEEPERDEEEAPSNALSIIHHRLEKGSYEYE